MKWTEISNLPLELAKTDLDGFNSTITQNSQDTKDFILIVKDLNEKILLKEKCSSVQKAKEIESNKAEWILRNELDMVNEGIERLPVLIESAFKESELYGELNVTTSRRQKDSIMYLLVSKPGQIQNILTISWTINDTTSQISCKQIIKTSFNIQITNEVVSEFDSSLHGKCPFVWIQQAAKNFKKAS